MTRKSKSRQAIPRLVTGELEILEMLWREGPVSLSDAHEALGQPIGYTTVQTRLNRLVKKQVVERTNDRPARYRAAITKDDVAQHDLDLLLERVSGGTVIPLVAHLVQDRKLSEAEFEELKQLIADAERKSKRQKKK